MSIDTDVIVVGAGPTGLLLAGDLAEQGVRCTLVERRDTESNLTRAFAVHARTLEQLDARGIADDLVAAGQFVQEVRAIRRIRVRFAGMATRYPGVLVTPQYENERLLERRAAAAGVRFLRGTEVRDVRQDADEVAVDVRAGGAASTLRASYVVGTDGVRSTVRKALGLPFPGESVVRSVMLADVRLTDPPGELLSIAASAQGLAFVAPFGGDWYRIIAWDPDDQQPDDAPVDIEEVRGVVARVYGTDLGMHDARWLSRFHSDERQVPQYRAGRVFLAGDAAHVHSPAGGQGMNTGLQDAANLSWKLAAAVRGWAPGWLLDSYQEERHPIGKAVLAGSGALLRLVLARTVPMRAARAFFGNVVGRYLRPPKAVPYAISGIGVRYQRPPGAHRMVGRRMPDIAVERTPAGATRLYEALRRGRFVLVSPAGDAGSVAPWRDRVDVVHPARQAESAVLVRPDGYVAWVGRADEVADLERACAHWLGEPVAASTGGAPVPA